MSGTSSCTEHPLRTILGMWLIKSIFLQSETASFGVFQLVYSELTWHSDREKNGPLHTSWGELLVSQADMDRQ